MGESRSLTVDVVPVGVLLAIASVVFLDRPHLYPRSSPQINLEIDLLPLYALYSFLRMLAAYILSLFFSVVLGYRAAVNPAARRWILPALDILQSVPILAFFPAAVFFFMRLFGHHAAGAECSAVFLIFTSQVWNMAFSVFESLTTVPEDLRLAGSAFRLSGWTRWRRLILPACVPKLTYNSMMSWAGGWYFLIASEIIAIGPASYTLPGLGSYIGQALVSGRLDLMAYGLGVLIALVVLLSVAVWNPAGWWSQRYLYEMSAQTAGGEGTPFMVRWARRSIFLRFLNGRLLLPSGRGFMRLTAGFGHLAGTGGVRIGIRILTMLLLMLIGYRLIAAAGSLLRSPAPELAEIPLAILSSFLRLSAAYLLSLAWTIPVAVWVGQSRRLARAALPVVQVAASVPATAFYPLIIVFTLHHSLSMNGVAVVLVLTGMQWYLLFNLIAGVSNIPADLREVSLSLGLKGWHYWRRVLLPAILPSLITGSITAWGGGWNALILSEYIPAHGEIHEVRGIGALLDKATYETGNLQVIVAGIGGMVLVIMLLNRGIWRPFYSYAAARFKMEY